MKIYCISIYNENYSFFESNNLIPVELGLNKFNDKWLNDKDGEIFPQKMIILESTLFIIIFGKINY